ncbi:MAG TPA: YicC/YloC family endoribonuclease [Thermoanaerobaculia bacterium]|nr:YicC/YloC family endoribonuclease [Thermoanaerobaculia bacterium]
MRSMTGFGRAAGENGSWAVTLTVKTVNGKGLDVQLYARGIDPALDLALREAAGKALSRGRVEIGLDLRRQGEGKGLVLDTELVRSLALGAAGLVAEGLVEPRLTLGDVLRIPDAVTTSGMATWSEEDTAFVLDLFAAALAEVVAARDREGAKLGEVLRARLGELEGIAARLDALRVEALAQALEAARRRIAELLGLPALDEARFAQEAAILADRTDVTEELDRLRAHLAHLAENLEEAGPIGKRLDFLLQEVFRELNTLGAKCRHPEVTRAVLDAKVLAEQVREQVQNLE